MDIIFTKTLPDGTILKFRMPSVDEYDRFGDSLLKDKASKSKAARALARDCLVSAENKDGNPVDKAIADENFKKFPGLGMSVTENLIKHAAGGIDEKKDE